MTGDYLFSGGALFEELYASPRGGPPRAPASHFHGAVKPFTKLSTQVTNVALAAMLAGIVVAMSPLPLADQPPAVAHPTPRLAEQRTSAVASQLVTEPSFEELLSKLEAGALLDVPATHVDDVRDALRAPAPDPEAQALEIARGIAAAGRLA